MRIGLVGYFGWGNYGDELFYEIFHQTFSGHELIIFHDPINGRFLPDANQLIDSVDAIIIGGGDLLMPWYKSWLYWDERYLSKPVFVFGVGVPTWDKSDSEVLNHYSTFLSHPNVKMISCRDEESVLWLKTHIRPDKEILFFPDMVLALRFPQQHKQSRDLGLVLRKQSQYVEKELQQVVKYASELGFSIKLIMLGTGKTLNDDYELFNHIRLPNYQIVVRDSIPKLTDEIASCSYLLSMKFHGIVAAYKCGVPFISLSGADKFTSFMTQTGNTRYSSTWADVNLSSKFEHLIYDGMDFSKRSSLSEAADKGLLKLVHSVLAVKN